MGTLIPGSTLVPTGSAQFHTDYAAARRQLSPSRLEHRKCPFQPADRWNHQGRF
jgi:hypothetical protein